MINQNKINELEALDILFFSNKYDKNAFSRTVKKIDSNLNNYDHCAVMIDNNDLIHASRYKNKVELINKLNLKVFANHKIHVYNIKEREKINKEEFKKRALNLIGLEYNHTFIDNEGIKSLKDFKSLYCSELVYYLYNSFIKDYFESFVLNFKEDGKISNYWIKYYKRLNLDIPKDKKGTNPNNLSASKQLIFKFEL